MPFLSCAISLALRTFGKIILAHNILLNITYTYEVNMQFCMKHHLSGRIDHNERYLIKVIIFQASHASTDENRVFVESFRHWPQNYN